jgi:putative peptidoglycan lipid II flippase
LSEPATIVIRAADLQGEETPSLAKASGSMAIATLISRVTGFGWRLALTVLLGITATQDAYNAANNFPNMIYELFVGNVLTSVMIPVLIKARHDDEDKGVAYTQRLVTMGTVLLLAVTVLAVACAPLLTKVFVDDSTGQSRPEVVTAFGYLVLPEILFYGVSALFCAILNAQNIFKAPAWAPVANNVIMFGTLAAYVIVPGDRDLNPFHFTDAKFLVLGIGSSLGVAAQAVVLVPALLRSGFNQFGGLMGWAFGYVLVSQVTVWATTRVATGAAGGGLSIYLQSWNLLQVPYGVLGVSLLTAIMPKMSQAAAQGDVPGVLDYLSQGSRLTAVMLVPISALMTVLGPAMGVALFSLKSSESSGAFELGLGVTASAFLLLPYAVTLLQLRVFYAFNDSRTPTVLRMLMVVFQVPLTFACPFVFPAQDVVYGIACVNGLTYAIGMVLGELWLRRRFGKLGSRRVVKTYVKTGVSSVWGAAAALAVALVVTRYIPGGIHRAGGAWLTLVGGGLLGLACAFGMMTLLRVHELQPALSRITRFVRRT